MKKTLSIILALFVLLQVLPATALTLFAAETNVALGKPVTGDGMWLTNAVDGDIGSYWDGGVCPCELTVDLEDSYDISKITLIPYYDGSRSYTFNIYTSSDGDTFTLYASKTDGSVATSSGHTFRTDVTARYVKAVILTNTANPSGHINELQVYGARSDGGALTDPNDPDNLAYGKPTRSTSTTGDGSAAVDGRDNTYFTGRDFPCALDVDLLDNYALTSVKITMPAGKWSYDLYGSLDGVNFTKLASHPYVEVTDGGDVYTLDGQDAYRILKVNVTTSSSGLGGNSRISEIRAYGTPVYLPVTPTREKMTFTTYREWLSDNYGVDLPANYSASDTYTQADTFEALYGIIDRLLGPSYRSWFTFEFCLDDLALDHYSVTTEGGKTKIVGNNGSSMAVGLNAFLKKYCNVHISQQTANVTMPAKMPVISGALSASSPYKIRYAYNYCTLSYTNAFFGYDDWQRELDYLALSGVNVILDTTATEALWVSYLQKFGYNADDAKNYVSGYAYKAWWLMGNLEGYGGNVSDQWILDTLEMARVNQRFMTVLGIKPCLQGFMGTLPTTFTEIAGPDLVSRGFSDITDYMVAQGGWSGFTRPPLLKTTYDGYETLANTFYDTQKDIYGDITDFYAGDLAHEGGVIPQDLSRSEMSGEILRHMLENDENAVWIIQCWWGNPEKAVLDGFGAENRANHVLVLDLNATISSNYGNTSTWGGREFNGSGWLYCMLDNFGGRPGVHGELESIKDGILEASRTTDHMKGIGLVSEGTQMNPVVQELLWEMAWRTEDFDLTEWLHAYAARRYGAENANLNAAWDILLETAYGYSGPHDFNVNTILNMLPSFSPSSISGTTSIEYDADAFEEAVDLFMGEFDTFKNKETYIYDAVDLIKQLLSNSMTLYFNTFVAARAEGDDEAKVAMAEKFMEAVLLMDEVCSYEVDSTIGEWVGRIDRFVNDPRTGAYDDYAIDMMKINAKAIITAWSCKILHAYAYRQYSGQIADYNYVMWSHFFDAVLADEDPPTNRDYFLDAWAFVISDKEYPNVVIPADGDADHRSLSALYGEIAENYLRANAVVLESTSANVALRGTPYAKNAQSTYPVTRLNDGDLNGLWVGTSNAFPTYAGITLDAVYPVHEVVITAETRANAGADIMQYDIQALQNGTFVTVAHAQSYDPETGTYTVTVRFAEPVVTSDIRVNMVSVAAGSQIWPALAEIRIMSYNGLVFVGENMGSVLGGELSNLPEGTTAGELKAAFRAEEGEISVVDANGNVLADSAEAVVGTKVVLTEDGEVVDEVVVVSIATEPQKPVVNLTGLRYGSGMENWINSANNPKGVGQAPGVTEILFGVNLGSGVTSSDLSALFNNKDAQIWTLYITDEDGVTVEKHIAPASTFSTASSNYFYRFEPCLADDIFVPSPGVKYKIDLSIESDSRIIYVTGDANGYTLSTFPVKADGTYYDASDFIDYPVALTVEPIYDQIENTYGKTWFVAAVSAGGVNDLFYSLCRDGDVDVKLTVKDETENITYVIDKYYFDDPNGYNFYGSAFMRFAPCEYGIQPVAGHAYTLTIEAYENGELHFSGSSEEGAFVRTNSNFAQNGPIVPDPVPHTSTIVSDMLAGDVNHTGDIDITDVTALLNLLASGGYDVAADLDGNGTISITDVTILLNVLTYV